LENKKHSAARQGATAREIAMALGGKRTRNDSYICRCPGPIHLRGDTNPSLSIRAGRDGKVLLHCFSGDAYADIVAALKAKGIRL
jgi:putative DNA primase/helicase